jgi:hypothetical protein
MSTKEFDKFLKSFKAYGKKVTSSEEENKKFLIGLKILTPSGKPTKRYKSTVLEKKK